MSIRTRLMIPAVVAPVASLHVPDAHRHAMVATGLLMFIASAAGSAMATEPTSRMIEFNRDIRPILSDKCFQCHGPDAKSREADLRLDERKDAVADRSGYATIVPGNADQSELMARILSKDPDERMPPASTKKHLTGREIELLRVWIDQDAPYQQHWSFLPIAVAEPPDVDSNWIKNPIDRFIVDQLQQRALKPSSQADSHTLIKRLSLDLVGLLPEPKAVESFVAAYQENPDAAVRTLARELLDSPHYGERWGRHWLDQARYADSNGYTIDGDRVMWPYRDWVIRAINDDMPFDRFTIEQLAGDLLPNATMAQHVATGFHRNTLINQEGGTDDEQFRNEEVVDRVNTTGAVWLGLTLGCAQCHSHKFDPISQKEFYQLFSFFNHTADVNNTGPTVRVSEGELLLKEIDPELQAALTAAQSALDKLKKSKAKRQTAWEKTLLLDKSAAMSADWKQLVPVEFKAEGGAVLEKLEDDSILAGKGAPRETYTTRLGPINSPIAALRLRVLPDDSLPKEGPGRASNGNFLLSGVEIRIGDKLVPVVRVQADHAQPRFSITNTIDGKPETGWAINVGKGSRAGVKMNAQHEAHFVFAKPAAAIDEFVTVILRHEVSDHYNIGRFAIDASSTAPTAEFDEPFLAAVKKPVKERTDEQKKLIVSEFEKTDSVQRAAESRVTDIRRKIGLGKTVSTMVMRELDEPRSTFIHIRGNFLLEDKKTGPLQSNVPEIFPALPTDVSTASRLDLARWLVSEDHPLTARVTVNRVWMRYFGRGLVQTENDFGTQGSFPTHPELLDWLARRLIESGWSMKALHETIVTSATYRQVSHSREELGEIDPNNELLARQNRIRVDAEIIRDVALSASGLLNPTIGGPSVRPPQPDGVYAFTQQKKSWAADTSGNRFRRALYTRFYRSAPYPMLTTFDAPDFQSVCTSRVRSNTPLQSLTMANDEAIFEMAQGLATRLLTDVEGTDDVANRQRIRLAFLVCYCRSPDDRDVEAVMRFQQRQAAHFTANAKAAESVAPEQYPQSYTKEIAASWTAVARALMNTDEFVTRE